MQNAQMTGISKLRYIWQTTLRHTTAWWTAVNHLAAGDRDRHHLNHVSKQSVTHIHHSLQSLTNYYKRWMLQ